MLTSRFKNRELFNKKAIRYTWFSTVKLRNIVEDISGETLFEEYYLKEEIVSAVVT